MFIRRIQEDEPEGPVCLVHDCQGKPVWEIAWRKGCRPEMVKACQDHLRTAIREVASQEAEGG